MKISTILLFLFCVLCVSCGKRGAQGNSVHTNDTVCTNSDAQGSGRYKCFVRSNDTICIDDSVRIYDMALEKVMHNDDVPMKPDTFFVFYVAIENRTSSHILTMVEYVNSDDIAAACRDSTYKRCSYIVYSYKDKHGKVPRKGQLWIWPCSYNLPYLFPYPPKKGFNEPYKVLYSAGMGKAPEGSVSIDIDFYLNLYDVVRVKRKGGTSFDRIPYCSRKIKRTFLLKEMAWIRE